MRRIALLIMLLSYTTADAAPPGCQEMADKITLKFESVKKMSGIDRAAKCRAISLLISDLTDMYSQCAIVKGVGLDENFVHKVYLPLANAIAAEAPKNCKG